MTRAGRWPWWAQVLAVHLAVRAFDAVVFALVARTQAANPWTDAAPSYLQYTSSMWDADWYRQIAEHGYPEQLPVGRDGEVHQNAWAFFPMLPGLARALGAVGVQWQVAAPLIALVAGTVAMLVVYRVVADLPAVAGSERARHVPLATVAILTSFASAPVLQVGYTEALALLLVAAILRSLQLQTYLVAIPLVFALGLTRAVVVPIAAVIAVHALRRWRAVRRGEEVMSPGQWWSVGALLVGAGVAALAWPAMAGLVTGEPDAFVRTQAAWRAHQAVLPLLPWVEIPPLLLGGWGGLITPAVLVLTAAALSGRTGRALGDLRTWVVAYLVYLVLATEPGTSQFRFWLLAFPLAVVPAAWALRRRRQAIALGAIIAFGLLGQVAWIALVWRLVPPSGWPP